MTSPLEQKKLKVNGAGGGDGQPARRRRGGLPHGRRRLDHRPVGGRRGDDRAGRGRTAATRASADDVRAVGPYVAPVELTADRRVLPGNLRERIRVAGPTIALPVVAAA